MLTHNQIWTAIDRLAARAKLTASGLAKKAGLDPTTFNKSKRITPEGRPRWPSTELVAKALAATGTKVDTFVTLITDSGKVAISNVPLIGFAEAGAGGYFDDGGFPVGKGWEEIAFPSVTDEHAYALEISGDSMKPAYRDGDVIVVSPAAPVRKGDRVVVKTKDGEVMVKELKRKNSQARRTQIAQRRAPRPHAADVGVVWDRAHRVGEPVTGDHAAARSSIDHLRLLRRHAASRFDRRRSFTDGGADTAAFPRSPSARGNYEAMLLTCIDPRFPEPTIKYMEAGTWSANTASSPSPARRSAWWRRVQDLGAGVLGQPRRVDAAAPHPET